VGLAVDVEPLPAARAQKQFLDRFDALYRAVHGEAPKPSRKSEGNSP
jgi:hypothetical protein